MSTISELRFAQRYPFSLTAKKVLRELDLPLEKVPDEVIKRAIFMIFQASREKIYGVDEVNFSEDVLKNEVMAYPVSKVLLSLINKDFLTEKFASMIAESTFKNLEREKNQAETALDLAKDLGIKFSLTEHKAFFVSIPLQQFLQISSRQQMLKLVNQVVVKGNVFLDKNDFCRFLSEVVYFSFLKSIPVDTANIPKEFKKIAEQVSQSIYSKQFKYSAIQPAEKINPNFFPPCMAKLYSDLLEGKNVQHLARFDVATFFSAVGMQKEQIISLFKKTPNFKESVTRYHVERIIGKSGKKYSAPSCAKLREHNLCVADCKVKHPLQFYRRELKNASQKQKQKKSLVV